VILPAYTAGSLIVAIKKAGLKPVLCEISPRDFNMDLKFLDNVVSDKTLCIIGVHMFGIAATDILQIKKQFPRITVIEDACQSMGTLVEDKSVGVFGDVSFFSFNKGKNLPTFGGGCIATDDNVLADRILQAIKDVPALGVFQKIKIFFKLIVLSFVVNPLVYGMLYSVVSKFKETAPPADIIVRKYTGLQAALALNLLKTVNQQAAARYNNACKIINALFKEQQLILPHIAPSSKPAFNRLPIVFRDLKKRQRVEIQLRQAGIETSRMYIKPLHHMFELGYQWGNFPNAVYLAGHLLTLPVHPMLKTKDIDHIIDIIKNA
jgi:dTDP-4-amino-4,6-dideoxygalactose transaminase